ncbi:MAG TPA: beta-eliminating lyase-related protein, partial [Rhizomicrobium sp.]
MNFASDNTAGAAPEIMSALAKANEGFALGYGNDAWTRRVERRIADVFKRDVASYLVTTGTACNSLAIAHVSPPWGAVLCHENAHIVTDECGAPEFFGHGIKLIGLPGDNGKVGADVLKAALEKPQWGAPHHVAPSVLSLSQASEAGTIYRPDEIRELSDIAHAHGLTVHMDGARLGNALARMNAPADEATWKAGVDVLSFGATKGGAIGAEAIVFFDPARAAGFDRRRKRGGHLLYKHRFVAVQMDAFLTDDFWLKLERHANALADR